MIRNQDNGSGCTPSLRSSVPTCAEDIARIIAPSAFAVIKSRTDGTPTGGLKYASREANRQKALAKAEAILALIEGRRP